MTNQHRDAFFRRGCALRSAERADLAAREFERAIEADPDHARSYAMLAYCRSAVGDERASDASLTALELDPADAFNHRARGWVLVGAGRATEALAPASDALRLSPSDVENHVLLAEVYLRTAKYADARAATDRALALSPQHAGAHRQRSVALLCLKRPDEARAEAETALSLEPNSFWSHLVLGGAALAQRDASVSAAAYREALRLDPSSPDARRGLLVAMKTRNFVYRGVVRVTTPFYRLPRFVRVVLVLGLIATGVGAFVIVPFVLVGRAADPVANFVLRFDRYGRHLLTPDQVIEADVIAMILLAVASGIVVGLCGARMEFVVCAVFAGGLVPWTRSVRNCRPGRDSRRMAAYVTLLAVMGIACGVLVRMSGAAYADASLPLWAGVIGAAGLFGIIFAGSVARRLGYPWSHHLDAPSH